MPLQLPNLDDRRYQQLLDDSLARVPIHTPEWTNFNQSDPGVTLVQLFAFVTETLLYRANQIPDRNRKKFLQLLGVPLQPSSSAQGIITLTNARGPLQTITLNDGIEVRAGQVPFRTTRGLDVLPVEAKAYFKMTLPAPPQAQVDYYKQLYASFLDEQAPADLQLYQSVPLSSRARDGVDLANETVDNALWIALLVRAGDQLATDHLQAAREAISGKTLNLGIAPKVSTEQAQRTLLPGTGANAQRTAVLTIDLPSIPASGGLPPSRQPDYRTLTTVPAPVEPAVFEVTLPDASQLVLWNNLDPLEPGSDALPPAFEDRTLNDRIITWLRVTWPGGTNSQVLWADVNATFVSQRVHVVNELLPQGTGEPDQVVTLSKTPVIADSVNLTVTAPGKDPAQWNLIDDLLSAGPEVPTQDLRQSPGVMPPPPRPANVFILDQEAGRITFGDGLRGARPPLGAILRVDYDYGVGRDGDVGEGAINTSPVLPAGLTVTNPVRTWGGADAESVADGEKQIARFLQHRDRLVSAADFQTIAARTPGVDIARVEVIPAYNPSLARNEPGNAPGAVTLMLIPKFSPTRPDAPEPDALFLKAVCDYLDPRRLVTTELFLCGPEYQPIWVSVGINVVAGYNFSTADVREAVKQRIKDFLAPINANPDPVPSDMTLLATPQAPEASNGWPLRRSVLAGELAVEVARVPGVALINQLLLAGATGNEVQQITMQGLQLPRLDGIVVTLGDPLPISQVRGDITAGGGTPPPPKLVPVPAIPPEC
jgi:predicted phage baseplate assembly protein